MASSSTTHPTHASAERSPELEHEPEHEQPHRLQGALFQPIGDEGRAELVERRNDRVDVGGGGGVVRGIHFADVPRGQAKYVTATHGAVLDYVIDTQEYGVATQKGSALSKPVSDAIQGMLDDGTVAALTDKWN